MDGAAAQAYLARIKAPRPDRPDAEALTGLMGAHLRSVPFENLSIHLDEPVLLDEASLTEKIVRRRRGGFCYELNGAFALLLGVLGYPVSLHAARVHTPDGLGPPFDHLALIVPVGGRRMLVDVGFGRFATGPLELDSRAEQSDDGGRFAVRDAGEGDLDVLHNGAPAYRLEPRPLALEDFAPTCWWQCTSPDAHFTRSLVCSLLTDTGRITLSGAQLITTSADGTRTERTLDADDLLPTYRNTFGITLDRLPTVKHPPPA